jgi:hypothetical protein
VGVLLLVLDVVSIQVVSIDTRGKKTGQKTSEQWIKATCCSRLGEKETYAGMQTKMEIFFQVLAAASGADGKIM